MADIFNVISGALSSIDIVTTCIQRGNFSKNQRKKFIEAIEAIRKASIKTKMTINKEGYYPNENIAYLWQNAMSKALEAGIDEGLPEYLDNKAKFWTKPQDWLDHPETLELVPNLTHLDEECKMLIQKIK